MQDTNGSIDFTTAVIPIKDALEVLKGSWTGSAP